MLQERFSCVISSSAKENGHALFQMISYQSMLCKHTFIHVKTRNHKAYIRVGVPLRVYRLVIAVLGFHQRASRVPYPILL